MSVTIERVSPRLERGERAFYELKWRCCPSTCPKGFLGGLRELAPQLEGTVWMTVDGVRHSIEFPGAVSDPTLW